MGMREWGLLLTLAGLWGSSFFFIKILVATIPPFTVVLARVGLAALVLHLILLVQRRPMHRALPWRQFLVMGLFNNVIPFSLIAWGETRIGSGLTSILNAMTPVFTVIIAHLFTHNERLSTNRALGVVTGVGGVVILIGPTALSGLGSADLFGEIACLLAAASYGLAGVYGRRFKGLAPMQVATGQFSAATLIMLPIAATEHFWTLPPPTWSAWGAIACMTLVCTVIAYILYFEILARAGATNVALVTLLVPAIALLLGYFILNETLHRTSLIGMTLIGISLVIIDGRLYRACRRKRAGHHARQKRQAP